MENRTIKLKVFREKYIKNKLSNQFFKAKK